MLISQLWMDQYFDRIKMLADHPDLPSRIRFMLQDVVELRSNQWRPRRIQREVAPKTIQEVHAEAAKELMMNPSTSHMAMNMNFGGFNMGMMGAGMDLFDTPHRAAMNGGPRGGMADVFGGPMSPPFMGRLIYYDLVNPNGLILNCFLFSRIKFWYWHWAWYHSNG
jgi:translation initiation factor 4G